MVDDSDSGPEGAAIVEHNDSFVDQIAHAVVMAATGIPPQIQKNLYQVAGSVIGHSAGFVNAYIDSKRKLMSARGDAKVAHIKAEQKADSLLVRKRAEAEGQLIDLGSLEARSEHFRREADRREQANREDVVQLASENISEQEMLVDANDDIDSDWLAAFFVEAGKRSSSDFKQIFSRILSGEIQAPGRFSIATLHAVARLNRTTAETFQTFCNISSKLNETVRIFDAPFGKAGHNGLIRFGLSYNAIITLVEDGLVRPNLEESVNIPALQKRAVLFEFAGEKFFIEVKEGAESQFRLCGPTLTRAGSELRSVLSMSPPSEYLPVLAKWLSPQSLTLNRVTNLTSGAVEGVEIVPGV